jgi:hypothetical protein
LTKKARLLSSNSRASHCYTELGNGDVVGDEGATEVTGVNTADFAGVLIGLLENLGALDGEGTVTVTLEGHVEGLRTKVLVCVIDHLISPPFSLVICINSEYTGIKFCLQLLL